MNPTSETPERPYQDVKTMRERARQHIDAGAVTASYGADPEAVIEMLNHALATEILCSLRYRRHYFMATGIASDSVKAEFLQHAQQEMDHAHRIAARIVQLGGGPDFNPATVTERSHAEYVEGMTLRDMIIEDLVAERVAIQSYTQMVQWLHAKDAVTHALLREVLAVEEEHADDMVSLLKGLPDVD
jgi:bacterioferritin